MIACVTKTHARHHTLHANHWSVRGRLHQSLVSKATSPLSTKLVSSLSIGFIVIELFSLHLNTPTLKLWRSASHSSIYPEFQGALNFDGSNFRRTKSHQSKVTWGCPNRDRHKSRPCSFIVTVPNANEWTIKFKPPKPYIGVYGSAEGPSRVVKIQNLLSHPDYINCYNEFAITHPVEIPTSVKSSGWCMMEVYVIRME